jgi:hypothetical protein
VARAAGKDACCAGAHTPPSANTQHVIPKTQREDQDMGLLLFAALKRLYGCRSQRIRTKNLASLLVLVELFIDAIFTIKNIILFSSNG